MTRAARCWGAGIDRARRGHSCAVRALFNDPRLSPAARAAIDSTIAAGDQVGVSAITVVELVYLVEKGKLVPAALDRTLAQLRDPASDLVAVPITDALADALRLVPRADVPDMPDRIIAAT